MRRTTTAATVLALALPLAAASAVTHGATAQPAQPEATSATAAEQAGFVDWGPWSRVKKGVSARLGSGVAPAPYRLEFRRTKAAVGPRKVRVQHALMEGEEQVGDFVDTRWTTLRPGSTVIVTFGRSSCQGVRGYHVGGQVHFKKGGAWKKVYVFNDYAFGGLC